MSEPTIRPVEPIDGSNGLFKIFSQLTNAPSLPPPAFAALVEQERRQGLRYTLVAVKDDGAVVATGAVFMEHKFIRGGAVCAHIEDIVVDKDARGLSLGKKIIQALVQIAKENGCYKVILDCGDDNVPFYEKCGFVAKERQMALYF